MKNYVIAGLIMFALSIVMSANAAEYGQPYGSTDETPMEATDVKSIEEVNEDFEAPEEEQSPPQESDESASDEQQESSEQ